MDSKFDWGSVFVMFVMVWMLYVGYGIYTILTRQLWPVVTMTYVCESDGKKCDWKWPTQILGK